MEKSFPFNAVVTDGVADRVYSAEDFAAERAAYVSNGVTSGRIRFRFRRARCGRGGG